jgi:hypothetical protein
MMQINSVDYIPIQRIPSDVTKRDQKGSLYLDEDELKKVSKESGQPGYFTTTEFRLTGVESAFNNEIPKFGNFPYSAVARKYDGQSRECGFKTFIGWIVDTVV